MLSGLPVVHSLSLKKKKRGLTLLQCKWWDTLCRNLSNKREMGSGFVLFLGLEVDVPLVLSLHEYILLRSVRGVQNMESWGSNILARLDPRPAGVLGGEGRGVMFQTQRYFCPPFLCFKVWSVALVAHRRELILVIQTDRPLGELVLWDYLTFLGPTVLWVTWQEMRGGN